MSNSPAAMLASVALVMDGASRVGWARWMVLAFCFLFAAGSSNIRVSIDFYLGLETGNEVQTIHASHSYSRRGWSAGTSSRTTVREYERGTLLIALLIPTDRSLV